MATLPSRLLDVKQLPNSAAVRVQDTSALDIGVQYLALSHCWGSIDTIKLTSTSLVKYYSSICYDELPRTFQDAVSVTRRLGFRYLWIDSLCIIQDSEEDWKRESAKMGDVYRNSTSCIAALAARNSEGGCFSLRDPTRYFTCKLGRSGNYELFVTSQPDSGQFDYSNGTFDRNEKPL